MTMLNLRQIKRIFVAIVGFTILLIGLLLLVLPGPAFIVIPVGLGILATEFIWAKKILDKLKGKVKQGTDLFRKKNPK
jgi:tellurite resistance protein TerC